MGLKEELVLITNIKQKQFIQYLVAGVKKDVAMKLCRIPAPTLKYWLHDNEQFHQLVNRVEELKDAYFEEAFQLLRHKNKVMALFLEEELLKKIKEEVESGEYNLVKTPLAKEVYNKALEEGKGIAMPSVGWMQFVQGNVANVLPKEAEQIGTVKQLPVGRDVAEDL